MGCHRRVQVFVPVYFKAFFFSYKVGMCVPTIRERGILRLRYVRRVDLFLCSGLIELRQRKVYKYVLIIIF